MKRGIMVGVAGVVAVVVACAGCSSNKSSTGASSNSGAPPAAAGPLVTVDGQNQNVSGEVTCNTANGVITIGIGDASAGVGAVLSTDNPPVVHSVGLGYVNGIGLGFSDAAPNQATNAGAAVNGKTYAIKGTATGTDMSNPNQPKTVTKSFEMDATCP